VAIIKPNVVADGKVDDVLAEVGFPLRVLCNTSLLALLLVSSLVMISSRCYFNACQMLCFLLLICCMVCSDAGKRHQGSGSGGEAADGGGG
jgi:hypothetical protein